MSLALQCSLALAALVLDVDTGDRLHLVRPADVPRCALTLRNDATSDARWTGRIACRDHFGEAFEIPVGVSAKAGETVRVPLGRTTLRKGVWYVSAALTDGTGATLTNETRFAVVDRHEVTPPLTKPHFRMGINYHAQTYRGEDIDLTLDALVASGAKLVRSGGFKFADVAGKGTNDWRMTDRILRSLRDRGLAVNANVYPGPAWARKTVGPEVLKLKHAFNVPTREGLFRDFCRDIAARYRGQVDYFEIGNEWDLTDARILPSDEALRLLKEGHDGVKAGDPSAAVITCGWAGADSSTFKSGPNQGLLERFAAEGQAWFDVWPLHIHGSYSWYEASLKRKFFPLRRRVMPTKPWYSNETAMSTVNGREAEVARTVWMKVLSAWAWGSTDYIWYNLRAFGPNESETGFGLVTKDYHPRATFAAFSALAALVHGGTFETIVEEQGSRHIYRFRTADGKTAYAGWQAKGAGERRNIASSARRAWTVDLMGNRTDVTPENGHFAWTVGNDPSALVLDEE